MEYTVKWEIQLQAGSPLDAAEIAIAWLRNKQYGAHIFSTMDEDGICHTVDLDEPEGEQVLPLTLDQFHEVTLNSK